MGTSEEISYLREHIYRLNLEYNFLQAKYLNEKKWREALEEELKRKAHPVGPNDELMSEYNGHKRIEGKKESISYNDVSEF